MLSHYFGNLNQAIYVDQLRCKINTPNYFKITNNENEEYFNSLEVKGSFLFNSNIMVML